MHFIISCSTCSFQRWNLSMKKSLIIKNRKLKINCAWYKQYAFVFKGDTKAIMMCLVLYSELRHPASNHLTGIDMTYLSCWLCLHNAWGTWSVCVTASVCVFDSVLFLLVSITEFIFQIYLALWLLLMLFLWFMALTSAQSLWHRSLQMCSSFIS